MTRPTASTVRPYWAGCTCDRGWVEIPTQPIPAGHDPDGNQLWIRGTTTVAPCPACHPTTRARSPYHDQPF